ncbi:coiled-coil domain-containing protein 92-like isoform X2 [Hypomesus transpacificus]|nr:coiled-coil domain-containing protein 92-like isoform X2 [Hypomesus transpacificus]XP_046876568.1 coiled-coil domain-containing protein 92-like isoform X2 [Hypomesus transpacificus]
MDKSKLEHQVAGVERGVAFLQQEHLAMLTGLHLEITHLRRRCQELSGELNSRFPERVASEEEVELAARCQAAECLLAEQQCMMGVVRGDLRSRRARATALGRSLRDEERRFLEELKRRSHRITSLSRELHRQTVTTSMLCQELHSARLRLFQQSQGGEHGTKEEDEEEGWEEEGEEEEEDEEEEEEDEGGGEDEDWLLTPPPPASPSLSERRRNRRVRVREERVRACVPQERVTSPLRAGPMPDPAIFLEPLRYRLLPWNRPIKTRERVQKEGKWRDRSGRRERVDMGVAEGETEL